MTSHPASSAHALQGQVKDLTYSRTRGIRGILHAAENLALTVLLAAMIVLPLLEIGLRQFSQGIPSAPELLRHLTLLVGMAGGALAAREVRLLALSTGSQLLRGKFAAPAAVLRGGVSAASAGFLCVASFQFVLQEREGGRALAYGIPLWIVQLALPLGFGLIAWRLVTQGAETSRGRMLVGVAAAACATLPAFAPIPAATLRWPALALLLAATLLGAPLFVAIGGAALILFWGNGVPIAAVPIDHYGLVTNPALPSIPLFTLAGFFMAEGGASQRLVRVFQAVVGGVRGGPAIAVALICAFFTAFTGGSGVTILALGGLLMPVLLAARFSERHALGLITGAGSLGILLPPCLPVILYAIIAKVDLKQMFLGGLLPGLLLIALTAAWGVWVSRRPVIFGSPARESRDRAKLTGETVPLLTQRATTTADQPRHFDPGEILAALRAAKWELALPVIALAALFGGWATPVEAAAVTAAYAFFTAVVVHRDLRIGRDCTRVMSEAGVLVGGILLILGVALSLTNVLIDAQVPERLAEWSLTHVQSRWLFLLGLNLVLILVGGVVEIFAAIVVMVPLLVPIGVRLGIDPVHLGIIFLANMELGFLCPPMGLNLLLSSSRLQKPIGEVARATLPLLGVMFLGVLLITYLPALTTWLPSLFP